MTVVTPAGTSATSPADQFTYAAAAPTVVSLVRFGFHMQQTSLVLTFSTALAATPAENVNNYQLVNSIGGQHPHHLRCLRPGKFDRDAHSLRATQSPDGLPAHGHRHDSERAHKCNRRSARRRETGHPARTYVNTFSGEILAGPATAFDHDPQDIRRGTEGISASKEKLFAAETKKTGVELRKLAAAEKRMAAPQKRIAAETAKSAAKRPIELGRAQPATAAASPPVVTALSASAVDALSVSGDLTPPPAPSPVRVGSNHPPRLITADGRQNIADKDRSARSPRRSLSHGGKRVRNKQRGPRMGRSTPAGQASA